MLEPLITKEVSDFLTASKLDFSKGYDENKLIVQLKKGLALLKPLSHRVLHYLLQHLKRVADIKGNMNKNLYTAYKLPTYLFFVLDKNYT